MFALRDARRLGAWLLVLGTLPSLASAGQFGVRVGTSTGGGTSVNSQEVYWRSGLPWVAGNPADWHLTSYYELNAGRLSIGGDSLTSAGANLGLWLRNPGAPIGLTVGTGPTYLSETQLGGRDFGGHWQFTSYAGVFVSLGANVALGYRIQHTSNAGLYSADDGYTQQSVEIRGGF
jgi:lipid A 3-O-deacylase